MFFIGCDPALTTCGIVVIKENYVMDLTGEIEKEVGTREYSIVYSECINLKSMYPSEPKVVGITKGLNDTLIELLDRFEIDAAFVENCGVSHNSKSLPVHVYNNVVQSSFYTFFTTIKYGSKHINPKDWKRRFGLVNKKKSIQLYRRLNSFSNVSGLGKLQTVHEWDAAMIALKGWEDLNK